MQELGPSSLSSLQAYIPTKPGGRFGSSCPGHRKGAHVSASLLLTSVEQ